MRSAFRRSANHREYAVACLLLVALFALPNLLIDFFHNDFCSSVDSCPACQYRQATASTTAAETVELPQPEATAFVLPCPRLQLEQIHKLEPASRSPPLI